MYTTRQPTMIIAYYCCFGFRAIVLHRWIIQVCNMDTPRLRVPSSLSPCPLHPPFLGFKKHGFTGLGPFNPSHMNGKQEPFETTNSSQSPWKSMITPCKTDEHEIPNTPTSHLHIPFFLVKISPSFQISPFGALNFESSNRSSDMSAANEMLKNANVGRQAL